MKITRYILICELIIIFLWLLIIGQLNGVSAFNGDINIIDEGQYAAWVSHMLHGKHPYKDFFVPYGPLQFYPIFIFSKYFGMTLFLVRLYTTVIGTFLGICVAFFFLKRFKILPIIQSLILIFLTLYPGINIRPWIVILFIFIFIDAYRRNSLKYAFCSGILLTTCFLESIDVGLDALIIFSIYTVGHYFNAKFSRKQIVTLFIILASASISFALFAIYATYDGWFKEYISDSTFILSVSGTNLPNGQGLPDIYIFEHGAKIAFINFFSIFSKSILFYWNIFALILFTLILSIKYILRKFTSSDLDILLILCFGIISYVGIIGRSGHALFYASFVVVIAGYFLTSLSHSNYKNKGDYIVKVILIIAFISFALRYLAIYRSTSIFHLRSGLNSSVSKVAPIGISKQQAEQILAIQRYFNNYSSATDTIFAINTIPGIYYLINRENATSYDLPILAYSLEKRYDLISQLQAHKPGYIIEDEKAWAVDGISDRQRLPEVIEYINANYRKSTKVGSIIIYKLNN